MSSPKLLVVLDRESREFTMHFDEDGYLYKEGDTLCSVEDVVSVARSCSLDQRAEAWRRHLEHTVSVTYADDYPQPERSGQRVTIVYQKLVMSA